MPLEFEDNSVQIKDAIKQAGIAWLHEAGGEIEAQTKRNSRVDKGQTKNTWAYNVDEGKGICEVGNRLENAIWEEFGTGEHALKGNGRKNPWYVPVDGYTGTKRPTFGGKVVIIKGRNGKKFYKTDGKKPSRAFQKAYDALKNRLQKSYADKLKGVGGR